MMKSFVVAFVLVAFVAFAMAHDDEEKRFIFKNECNSNSECPVGKCCRGPVKKTCKDYTKEGKRCYSSIFSCGCEPGTSCKLVRGAGLGGLAAFICAPEEGEGSGIDM